MTTTMTKQENEQQANNVGSAIFESSNSYALEFMDKVRAIHEYFDKDKDGHLNFQELSSLQLITSGARMDSTQYEMVCKAFGCNAAKGLPLDALKLTYAADGTNANDDYNTVFGTSGKGSKHEDDVIEVGDGPIDISPGL